MLKLNYYSHLLLNSKYSLLIKLTLIFSIYALFYIDNINDIVTCAPTKKHLIEKLESLKAENSMLKNELNRFRMSIDPNSYREVDTLNTLKERIESYRLRHAEGFLTLEEQERPSYVRHTGVNRSDFNLGPEFFFTTQYKDVTTNAINPHASEFFKIDSIYIDKTGKQIIDLHKTYRVRESFAVHTQFKETDSWFFYDYKERYKEIFYPANHPDNNFDPAYRRIRKLVEREFYEKQLPDKISENCNIS